MSRAPQLEQEVLPGERGDIREVAVHANASRPLASGARRSGSCVRDEERRPAAPRRELAVEQRRSFGVERGERLVEQQQRRLVQEDAAEREPLEHPARERAGALVARVPQVEALEQHPDPLAPLGHAVEPAVEIEVLQRGQLAVDERLVREEAERRAVGVDVELTRGRQHEPGDQTQERRLSGAVRPGDEHEAAGLDVEVEPFEDALRAVALGEAACPDHHASSLESGDGDGPDRAARRR